jgi:hypothetical protein
MHLSGTARMADVSLKTPHGESGSPLSIKYFWALGTIFIKGTEQDKALLSFTAC